MHNKTLLLYLLACLLLFTFGTYGEQKSQFTPIQGSYTSEAVETNYSITTSLGTHIVGIGVSSSFFYTTDVQAAGLNLGFIETGALLEFKHYRQYLGIPGDSQTGTMGLSVTYGAGRENSFPSTPYNHAGPGRHNFSYRYNWYTSTDATNQSTGRFVYELVGNRDKVKLQMENDMLAFKIPIRDALQNTAHRIGNWYTIPKLERKDRWYFQLSLFSLDSLYR